VLRARSGVAPRAGSRGTSGEVGVAGDLGGVASHRTFDVPTGGSRAVGGTDKRHNDAARQGLEALRAKWDWYVVSADAGGGIRGEGRCAAGVAFGVDGETLNDPTRPTC
jgi:hypothetical protein